jgi:hypothetical protein
MQLRLGRLEVSGYGGQPAFGAGDRRGDALLLVLEQVERDGVGIVRLEQLLAFALERAQPTLLRAAFAIRPQCAAWQARRPGSSAVA